MIGFKAKVVRIALMLGVVAALAVLASATHLHALDPGLMTPGHQSLACVSCHAEAPGTMRQQIQANLRHLLGRRTTAATFGFRAPADAGCLGCHVRPEDPHAVHRFAEPRFAQALRTVRADSCLGCHREHRGTRVASAGEFCAACHGDLALKDDPLDVGHAGLIAQARWSSCLGCHDYHGDHVRRAQHRLADAFDAETVRNYLAGGPDPYGRKRHVAPTVAQP